MFPVIPNAKGKKDPDIYIYIYRQRPLNQPECDTN